MKKFNDHIDFEKDFFQDSSISYPKSKEEIWAEMELKLSARPQGRVIRLNLKRMISYSVAAVLIIGLGLLSFLRFYQVGVNCPHGQHVSVKLPDGSRVTLNAGSEMSYNPYWWEYSRKIRFAGEAYFEVKKGNRFEVRSEKASTTVLGTSFNIYSRNQEYRVNCITGKVMVKTKDNQSVVLSKNESSVVGHDNKILTLKDENLNKNAVAWMKNEFIFTSMPLKDIFAEFERQFDIEITGKEKLTGVSTFNARRGSSPEEIINLVGKPFGVKCVKISDRKFIVEQK
jgi:ferric-dicitrate binding protein FerR (iron transport regulator)